MTRVRVTTPATTCNLGPGLDCMALALELYNTIELAEIEHGLHLDVQGEFASQEMERSARLMLRVVTDIFHQAGYLPGGLRACLEINIPPGDSLGGDAATLLGGAIAANILLGSPFTREEVLQRVIAIESRHHALLAALLGGLVISSYDDRDLVYAPVRIAPTTTVIVLPPTDPDRSPIDLPDTVSLDDAIFNIGHAALLVQALSTGDLDLLAHAMRDRLHETAISRAIPGYKEMIEAAAQFGVAGVAISGMGPALIAFSAANHDELAEAMAHAYYQTTQGEAQTWVLPIDTQGISISEIGMTTAEKPIPASEHPVTFDQAKSPPPSPALMSTAVI